MTGPEHYAEAERLLRRAPTVQLEVAAVAIAEAQAHATLALAEYTRLIMCAEIER